MFHGIQTFIIFCGTRVNLSEENATEFGTAIYIVELDLNNDNSDPITLTRQLRLAM